MRIAEEMGEPVTDEGDAQARRHRQLSRPPAGR